MNTRFIWLSPVPPYSAGEIIGDKPTFPINAKVVGDFLYLRDENGNLIPGRQVDNGDEIVVLDVLYSKQLAMIQYPTSKGYVHGYVTNAVNIIKYNGEYNWQNGSTKEPVYDEENKEIGSLDPHEKATLLYQYPEYSPDKYCVVYNTDKGKNTKSGFVRFEGIQSIENLVKPGEIVGSTPTYPTNATVVKDFLYLRDEKGNLIPGRQVDVGDRMTVLDVSYSRQLALVQYPTSQGFRQGYVTNVPELINYDDKYKWCNGSTSEPVFFEDGKGGLGTLSPYERATILYKHKNGMYHVVYGTNKGPHSKSGYVKYEGGSIPNSVSLPEVNESNVTKIRYGTSAMGNPLEMYKVGNGKKILFAGFGIHGFEDEWFRDSIGLAHIANELIKSLAAQDRSTGLNDWTVYISQSMNPDGLMYGWSHNGPGRCAVGSSVDMNRCFPTNFKPDYSGRNYTGSKPLMAIEAEALANKIRDIKNNEKPTRMVVLDCHGWMNETIGDEHLGRYFCKEFGFRHRTTWGEGYFSTWAKALCDEALLVEYPITKSLNDVYAKGLHTKTIDAVKGILKTGNSSDSEGKPLSRKGEVINISSYLNVRNGASHNASIIGTLQNRAQVEIVEENGEWYKIKYNSGYGYVFKEYIAIIDGEESVFNAGGIVTTSVLNVREYAFTNSSILGTLNKDSIVDIVAKISTWYKIRYNNSYGYVAQEYVDIYNDKPVGEDYFIRIVKELEEESKQFRSSDKWVLRDVLNYLRHIKYNTTAWKATLGECSEDFVLYINNNKIGLKEQLIHYIQNNNIEITIKGATQIDLPHLAATILGYISSPIVPDFYTGWGGDLATLMHDVAMSLMSDNIDFHNKEEIRTRAEKLLAGDSHFGISDIKGDADAIGLARLCSITSLSEALNIYYPTYIKKRKDYYIQDFNLLSIIGTYTVEDIISSMKLLGISYLAENGEHFTIISNDIKSICCEVFINYIENSQDYMKN